MKRRTLTLVALILAPSTLLAAVGVTWSMSRGQQTNRLPQVVRDAIQRQYPHATVGADERGRMPFTVYEVAVQDGSQKLEVLVGEDGTIVAIDQEVTWNELPPAVAQTLGQAAGSAEVKEIERTERRAKLGLLTLPQPETRYEAEWKRDGRHVEIGIAADGTLLGDGDEEEEDDEEDEDEDEGENEDD